MYCSTEDTSLRDFYIMALAAGQEHGEVGHPEEGGEVNKKIFIS